MNHHEIPLDLKVYSLAGTDQEVAFIIDVLNLPPGANILDLYCGYGRHAIELAKKGYNVTGVDATQAFLDIASQKAKEEQILLAFKRCDMRELNYEEQFHAVINMFAAFGYFSDEENSRVLSLVARALRNNGLILIDLFNREWLVRNNLNRYWRHPNGEIVLSYKVELEKGFIKMKRQLLNHNNGAKTQYEFCLRAYSQVEILDLLTVNGFELLDIYGSFDKRPYSVNTPRMIILAKKKSNAL